MDVSSSQAYANFRAWVPRNVLPVGALHPLEWVYYDWGPRAYPEPLILLHGLIGSGESFFPQVTTLAPLGYRLISVQLTEYWTVAAFCDALHAFLDALSLARVHLYGVGVGGFLAMSYLARRPERVASVALTHSYLATGGGGRYSPAVLRWLPDFLVRRGVRDALARARVERRQAAAAEFEMRGAMRARRGELAARMALRGAGGSVVGRHRLAEERITLIDSTERASERDVEVAFETARFLPGAKRALLKGGGDFPYISAAEEVNMHLIVHMRRNAPLPKEGMPVPPPAMLPKVWRQEAVREEAAAAATGSGSPVSQAEAEGTGSEGEGATERNGSQASDGIGEEAEERRVDEERERPEKTPLLAQFLPAQQNS